MPGKLPQHHLAHGLTRAKSFLAHAYHGTRKLLQHADVYSSMFRRVLAAAQPALQDLGRNRLNLRAKPEYPGCH